MRWAEFATGVPELATLGEERLRRQELCMLGTLRQNGYPRISPCEPDFVADELVLGMMWQSPKARDLLRDARCVVHSCTSDRAGAEGDFKLYANAVDVQDAEFRERYRETVKARIDWAPDEPNYHLFALDVQAAGFVIFGDDRYVLAWNPERGLRRRELAPD